MKLRSGPQYYCATMNKITGLENVNFVYYINKMKYVENFLITG